MPGIEDGPFVAPPPKIIGRGKHAYKLPFDPRGVLCTGCGYNLTGNVSGRCPECFTPVLLGPVSALAAPQELSRTF